MDAGGHLRAWEDNSSTAHSSTSRLPNSNQKHQMPTTHSGQTANSTILPPHDRTLPSLSSVFESNSITSASNRPLLFYDPGNSNSPEIKTPAAPDQGVKRPRLSQNEGRKSEVDIPRGSTLGPVPDRIGYNNNPTQGSGQSPPESETQCSSCARAWHLMKRFLSGLRGLEAEIYRLSNRFKASSFPQQENDKLSVTSHAVKDDLVSSLAWAARVVESGRSFLGELASAGILPSTGSISRTGLAQVNTKRSSPGGKFGMHVSPEEGRCGNNGGFAVSSVSRDGVHHSAGPLVLGDDRAGNIAHEQASLTSQSSQERLPAREALPTHPQQQSTSCLDTFARQHPHLAIEPSTPSSSSPAFSAHSAHVQDLQHQVSTKTLALQTLQREHDSLLAAFSRQQTSYSTLDKKTKVADMEIKELTEEKISLQSQVDNLEAQVEELFKSKEDAHQQSAASGAQYMKIMAMSSRLQAQSVTDQKKWKAEKQEWEMEKEELLKKIQNLEAGSGRAQNSDQIHSESSNSQNPMLSSNDSGNASHASEDLTSIPPEDLRSEVATLRQRCREMETTLKDLAEETESLDGAMQQLRCVSGRIRQKARPENQAQQTHKSSEQPDEQAAERISGED